MLKLCVVLLPLQVSEQGSKWRTASARTSLLAWGSVLVHLLSMIGGYTADEGESAYFVACGRLRVLSLEGGHTVGAQQTSAGLLTLTRQLSNRGAAMPSSVLVTTGLAVDVKTASAVKVL